MDLVNKVTSTLEVTRIHKLTPDLDAVDEVLGISGRDLSSLSASKLSEYIYTLTQHIVYLQSYCNIKTWQYIEAKRQYELALNRELSTHHVGTKLTVAEKKAHILGESPEIQALYSSMVEKEAEHSVLDKIPEQFVELVNAFKKELSLRLDKGIK